MLATPAYRQAGRLVVFLAGGSKNITCHKYLFADKFFDPSSRRRVPALRSFRYSLLTFHRLKIRIKADFLYVCGPHRTRFAFSFTSHLVATRLGLGTNSLPSKLAWVTHNFLLEICLTTSRLVSLRPCSRVPTQLHPFFLAQTVVFRPCAQMPI